MFDIFTNYTTGSREWTYSRKRFTEYEFRSAFEGLLPNGILHDAAAAFLAATHIDVFSFAVPMNRSVPLGMQRMALFIRQYDTSEYWNMFSFLGDNSLGAIRAFDDGHTGSMSEYDILDLIETRNDAHQRALIETWFNIDNWFGILTLYGNQQLHGEIEDVINGQAPEPLNPAADAFVPELAHHLQLQAIQPRAQQVPVPVAYWDVRDLI
jgi:hypothetical protein